MSNQNNTFYMRLPIVGLMRDNSTFGVHECILLVTSLNAGNEAGLNVLLGEGFLQNFPAAFAYNND
jgi:hypothetical protein